VPFFSFLFFFARVRGRVQRRQLLFCVGARKAKGEECVFFEKKKMATTAATIPAAASSDGIDVRSIPRWGSEAAAAATESSSPMPAIKTPTAAGKGKIVFGFAPELNERVALWSGDFWRMDVDAIVCPTNERMDDVGGPHEIIRERGGEALATAITTAGACRMSESKLTPAFNIRPHNVVHTVGPRYNAKYTTAAVNSLNK
jgi:hypothetical protein